MINVENIQVVFGKGTPLQKQALNGVSLTIEEGSSSRSSAQTVPASRRCSGFSQRRAAERRPASRSARRRDAQGHGGRAGLGRACLPGSARRSAALVDRENLALAARRAKDAPDAGLPARGRREHFRERIAELNLGLENRMRDRMDLLSAPSARRSRWYGDACGLRVLLLDEHTAALDPEWPSSS